MERITRKRQSHSHRIADQMKEQRRVEGGKRKQAWEGLTLEEKLEKLAARPGESRKQVFKLTGQNTSAIEALQLIRK